MFKPAQVRPSHTQLQELGCPRCGVVLVVEVPKGESSYTCVCGFQLEVRMTQDA